MLQHIYQIFKIYFPRYHFDYFFSNLIIRNKNKKEKEGIDEMKKLNDFIANLNSNSNSNSVLNSNSYSNSNSDSNSDLMANLKLKSNSYLNVDSNSDTDSNNGSSLALSDISSNFNDCSTQKLSTQIYENPNNYDLCSSYYLNSSNNLNTYLNCNSYNTTFDLSNAIMPNYIPNFNFVNNK